ncbi:hypothetical protein GCM10018780_38220 [Streptomyces lanatus]|nr:hypothetical protein GCM10018780_38220 [Streptomyces lanatus]
MEKGHHRDGHPKGRSYGRMLQDQVDREDPDERKQKGACTDVIHLPLQVGALDQPQRQLALDDGL